MFEMQKKIVGVTMGNVTDDEIIEDLRRKTVYCMKAGDTFVVYFDKLAPDFNERFNNADSFPMTKISDFTEWRKEENYMAIVKAEEDKGLFSMKPDFTMVFLATFQDDENAKEVLSMIPRSNEMVVMKII